MVFFDGLAGEVPQGVANMEGQLLLWLRNAVSANNSSAKGWGKARLLEALRKQSLETDASTSAFCKGEEVLAHWMIAHPSGRGIIIDPDELEWLPGTITEQAKTRRGEGASFGVLFRDGNHHPGVPFAHIRRLVSGQRT